MEVNKKKEKPEKPHIVVKSAADLQRLKLEKLMRNPDKLVSIPEPNRTKSVPSVPDFVRNVMGSSAGAGSGEFHVYRHLRRKEYARQKFIQDKGEKEKLEDEYHDKLEKNKMLAEEKTAKKRAKRLKKKQKAKENSKKPKITAINENKEEVDDDDSDDDENETEEKQIEEEDTEKVENQDKTEDIEEK